MRFFLHRLYLLQFQVTFNSLYEILTANDNWLSYRFFTFNSLYEIQFFDKSKKRRSKLFQFSLWDSEREATTVKPLPELSILFMRFSFEIVKYGMRVYFTFNSLYEIPYYNYARGFEFFGLSILFMRFFWVLAIYRKKRLSFNSLYEILYFSLFLTRKNLYILSILFMRFNMTVVTK